MRAFAVPVLSSHYIYQVPARRLLSSKHSDTMKSISASKDNSADADLIPAEMKPLPVASEDVRPHALLSVDELLARFGDRAGAHGPNSALKKAYMVRIPKDAALSWSVLARRLGTRPATLMAQLLVAAASISPQTWHASVAALQRSAAHVRQIPGDAA